ncbi:hypothetical protein LUCX_245 [Xanthomonas phage vB_XciM_LucasX]|nr:hypothetical protein LUCX_245 [Xanthomonas phage vB_XciM_LucasX]
MSNLPSDVIQTLLDGINRECALSLTKDQVVFGTPEPSTQQGRNTKVRVEAASVHLVISAYYYRLELSRLLSDISRTFPDEGQANTLDLIPQIAARRQLSFNVDDFVSTPIERTEGQPTLVTLQARADSLTLLGAVEITLGAVNTVPDNALLTREGDPIYTREGDFLFVSE